MSDAKSKAPLKALVAIIIIFSVIALLGYGVYTKEVSFKGEIDVGVLEGFVIGTAATTVVKWLFGDE